MFVSLVLASVIAGMLLYASRLAVFAGQGSIARGCVGLAIAGLVVAIILPNWIGQPHVLPLPPSVMQFVRPIGLLAFAVWLVGALLVAIHFVAGVTRMRRLVRGGTSDHAASLRLSELLSDQFDPGIGIVLIDEVISPCLWRDGRKAKIVIPRSLWHRLSSTDRDCCLWHEWSHFHAGDDRLRLALVVPQVLLWWHPLLPIALKRQRELEEIQCDALAASRMFGGRAAYARSLLNIVDTLQSLSMSTQTRDPGRETVVNELFASIGNAFPIQRWLSQQSPSMADELHARLSALATRHVDPPDQGRWSTASQKVLLATASAWVLLIPSVSWIEFEDAILPIRGGSALGVIRTDAVANANVAGPQDTIDVDLAANLVRQDLMDADESGGLILGPTIEGWWTPTQPIELPVISIDERSAVKMLVGGGGQLTLDGQSVLPPHPEWTVIEVIPGGVCRGLLSGQDDGSIRLWDPATGMSRSLVGRHSAAITAIAATPIGVKGHVVKEYGVKEVGDDCIAWVGDEAGNVIRWNLADGSSTAVWNSGGPPIVSLCFVGSHDLDRFDDDVPSVFVMTGDWQSIDRSSTSTLHRLDAESLDAVHSTVLPGLYAAIVGQHDGRFELANWNGEVHRMFGASGALTFHRQIDKTLVSAIVFSSCFSLVGDPDDNDKIR